MLKDLTFETFIFLLFALTVARISWLGHSKIKENVERKREAERRNKN